MLVIVENGDITALFQPSLNFKAAGRRDILQIHAAKAAGKQGHRIDDVLHLFAADAQRDGVHVAKGLEEDALALHHRHTGLRSNISKPQHSGAVCHYCHSVPPAGQIIAFIDILLDLQTRLGYARRVGKRQGLLIIYGGSGGHFQFAAPLAMQPQGFFCIIHICRAPYFFKSLIVSISLLYEKPGPMSIAT